MVRLDIFSDPICPWCLIGKTLLDRALESRPGHPFAVEWHPFRLNPDMPPEGIDRAGYYAAKFGGPEQAAEVTARVEAAARAAGLEIDLGAIARVPDTTAAHCLIHWAGIEGVQGAVVSALFRAYFREGRDIGNPEVLADLAAGAGMIRRVVARMLAQGTDREMIAEQDAAARAMGITGVPLFLVAGQHAVTGAQPVALWQQVIDELAERQE